MKSCSRIPLAIGVCLAAWRTLSMVAATFTMVYLAAPGVLAQSASGGIFGRVVGATPAELSGGTATIVNPQTNTRRTVPLSSAGTFQATNLPVDTYEVTLNLTGRPAATQRVAVTIGAETTARFDLREGETVKLEKFEVTGSSFPNIDVTSTEVGISITLQRVKELPVTRNLTEVALLAPGVIEGDPFFENGNTGGTMASFGGASIAENAYYLNGFNITDLRRGIGFSGVPFEFFQDFQIKTTGYSAMFGRSTGGVVNAVSHRGNNTFHGGFSAYWTPNGLLEKSPDAFRTNGDLYKVNSISRKEDKQYNFYGSGPLIKDKLFFYGLYNARDVKQELVNGTNQYFFRKDTDPFWALRFDWQALRDHSFDYTVYSNTRTRVDDRYNYPLKVTGNNYRLDPVAIGASIGKNYDDFGGRTQIARYSGRFFDNLTITGMAAKNTANATSRSDASNDPYVQNSVTNQVLSGVASVTDDMDYRKAYRLDGAYSFNWAGPHRLSFGYDLETNKSFNINRYSGDVAYILSNYTGGAVANGGIPPAGTTRVAQVRTYRSGGEFRVITGAQYLEDNWKLMSERLVLNLGVRRENFDNRNSNDKTFVKMDNQWAPRISGAYDLKGDGLAKIFGSFGRYYLQIPTNTNVRQAGAQLDYTNYYVLTSSLTDKNVVLGDKIGNQLNTGLGIVPEPSTIVDANLGPMYQHEFVLGYSQHLNRRWSFSVTGIFRDLRQIIEDMAVDSPLLSYAKSKGYNKFEAGGFDYYVLSNPGKPVTISVNFTKDTNNDGVVDGHDQENVAKEQVTLPAAELGYPKGTRKHYALEFKLDRAFADKWTMQASYVWSHTYGNYEGSVWSDRLQRDAGITALYDQPGIMDGTYGNLPVDRRHVFKANGSYRVLKQLTLSGNASAQSGRPISALGLHPIRPGNATDAYARAYGVYSMYQGGVLVPRGSRGTTPWVYNVNLGLQYKPKYAEDKVTLGVDVFNVFNRKAPVALNELSELTSGAASTSYLSPRYYQNPRSVRFTFSYDM